MPKVTAPLFSAGASGQFGDICEFRMVNGKSVVCKVRTITAERRPQQEAQAARFKAASVAWNELMEPQKQQWKDAAELQDMNGRQLYIREFLQQGIVSPAEPVLPV